MPRMSKGAPGDRLARPRGFWSAPALGPMLRDRRLAVLLAAAGLLQLAAGLFRFKTVPCPMLKGVGIPCPGCCASRACAALLRGDWRRSVELHAMAPCFLGGVVLFAAASVLPRRANAVLADWMDRVEARAGVVKLLLTLLILYWVCRLAYAPAKFVHLARGDPLAP